MLRSHLIVAGIALTTLLPSALQAQNISTFLCQPATDEPIVFMFVFTDDDLNLFLDGQEVASALVDDGDMVRVLDEESSTMLIMDATDRDSVSFEGLLDGELAKGECLDISEEIDMAVDVSNPAFALSQEESRQVIRKLRQEIIALESETESSQATDDQFRQIAVLNEQVAALRRELGRLQALLDIGNEQSRSADVNIESLTQDLNTALARALLAERRVQRLEETTSLQP